MADLADYLGLTVGQAREQFRALLSRRPVSSGRQVTFLPAETLLCLAASFVVNHRHYGHGTENRTPEPVPSLARLFSRPLSSVLAKMANLDGSLSHGGKWDVLAGAMLRDDPARFSHVYRVLLHAARIEGIGQDLLPDFLGLEPGGELALLGQEELDISTLEAELREQIARRAATSPWSDLETERILCVLSSLKARPRGASHAASRALTCSASCLVWQKATRSSAYLITTGEPGAANVASLPVRRYRTPAAPSIPCSATFSRHGLITPPWGTPSPVRVNRPSSTTPARSHPAISSLAGNVPNWPRR